MEIVTLPPGQPAGAQDDCIRIQELSSGAFDLTGTVLATCSTSGEEAISLIGSDPYDSYDAAEAAGLAWAAEHCVVRLHVTRSIGTQPLPDVVG